MNFYNNYDTSTLLCLVLPVVITSTAVVLVIGDAGEKSGNNSRTLLFDQPIFFNFQDCWCYSCFLMVIILFLWDFCKRRPGTPRSIMLLATLFLRSVMVRKLLPEDEIATSVVFGFSKQSSGSDSSRCDFNLFSCSRPIKSKVMIRKCDEWVRPETLNTPNEGLWNNVKCNSV